MEGLEGPARPSDLPSWLQNSWIGDSGSGGDIIFVLALPGLAQLCETQGSEEERV